MSEMTSRSIGISPAPIANAPNESCPAAEHVQGEFREMHRRYTVLTLLKRLFGKDDRFFDLLEALAGEACKSVTVLHSFLLQYDHYSLEPFAAMHGRARTIQSEINTALCTHFIPRLDPEDIAELTAALYKIPEAAEKIAQRLSLAPPGWVTVDLAQQAPFNEKAVATVHQMVQVLRKGFRTERIQVLNNELQELEGRADTVFTNLLGSLYGQQLNPVQIVYLKDLFERQERIADRCRDAGNVIKAIVLRSI